jgi:hypothetical protein
MASGQPQSQLAVAALVTLDKFLNVGRHVPQLKIAAVAQLLGKIPRNIPRPAFERISVGAAIATKVVNHKITV